MGSLSFKVNIKWRIWSEAGVVGGGTIEQLFREALGGQI